MHSRRKTFRCEPYFIPLARSEDGCRDTDDGNMMKQTSLYNVAHVHKTQHLDRRGRRKMCEVNIVLHVVVRPS